MAGAFPLDPLVFQYIGAARSRFDCEGLQGEALLRLADDPMAHCGYAEHLRNLRIDISANARAGTSEHLPRGSGLTDSTLSNPT